MDLEAVEGATRSAVHRAGASVLARISHRARLADKVGNETGFAKSRLIAMVRIAA